MPMKNPPHPGRLVKDNLDELGLSVAQAAEGLGYHCIEVADHVFGAAPRGDWKPVYSELDPFHETFTTMAFLAAVTKTIKILREIRHVPI